MQADYYYFEAFDESWKAAYEGPQGAHWGSWTQDGTLKPGMQAVFDG
jgi:exo-beta-1,3-glucanase (GH17 family)